MSCPSDDTLLRALLGELSVYDASELERHLRECSRCARRRAAEERLLSDLRPRTAELERSADSFTAGVLSACRTRTHVRPAPSRPKALQTAFAVSFAAVAELSLGLPRVVEVVDRAPETWAARGSRVRNEAPSADVLFLRAGVARPVAGATLQPGDGFVVRCTNPGSVTSYLAVFALDARGEAHWIYPAYVDATTDPQSIPIAGPVRALMLEEAVEPDAPANGPMRVFALSSSRPLRVGEIERELAAFAQDEPRSPFADVHVQQWRARWNDR